MRTTVGVPRYEHHPTSTTVRAVRVGWCSWGDMLRPVLSVRCSPRAALRPLVSARCSPPAALRAVLSGRCSLAPALARDVGAVPDLRGATHWFRPGRARRRAGLGSQTRCPGSGRAAGGGEPGSSSATRSWSAGSWSASRAWSAGASSGS